MQEETGSVENSTAVDNSTEETVVQEEKNLSEEEVKHRVESKDQLTFVQEDENDDAYIGAVQRRSDLNLDSETALGIEQYLTM